MISRLAVATAFLAIAACADEPDKAGAPTAPPTAIKSALASAPAAMNGATVCLSYGRDRALARAELKGGPSPEKLAKLQAQLKSLDELILDAC